MNFRTLMAVCVAQALVVGCGGGAGDSSFGFQRMASSLMSEVGIEAALNLTGVASTGSPLVGVVVSATNRQGKVYQSSPTDANGRFSLSVSGLSPYVLTVAANDIDGAPILLSSVYTPGNGTTMPLNANINPLTSLITSRVLGTILTSMPTGEQIKNANITPDTVAQATSDISTLFQPVYNALAIPLSEANDPIGTTDYRSTTADPLESLFLLARFKARTNEVSIGTDADRTVISVPVTGEIPRDIIPAASINSLAALHASDTRTPIKHVIVVIGENRTFDMTFATYQAPEGQTVKNLLSQGIVNVNGTPGPNFDLAKQNQGTVQTTYNINPARSVAFATLPQPTQFGAYVLDPITLVRALGGTPDPHYPANMPNGPFPQTNAQVPYYSATLFNPLGVTTADPPHRFFQMWQQTGGTNENLDMYTWVATTAGKGGDTPGVTPTNPGAGSELMAFLNMQMGDIPEWKTLAQNYAISDNYHQSIMGGTGSNFFAIVTGDMPYFNADVPIFANQIENPNPMDGTFNFYEQDGYNGGSYVNCSDSSQPGVAPILAVLDSANVQSNCEDGKYYLVNNYGYGYDKNGNVQPLGPNNFTLPPQTVPTIAESLANKGVSWKWYTGARESADVVADLAAFGLPNTPQTLAFAQGLQYLPIADPLVASQNVMTSPTLKAGLAGVTTLYNDIQNGTLPAVSFVAPKNLDSGHPGYSIHAKYEQFTKNLIAKVKANPALWANTAIIITTDEGGGYFDTGSIQMQDFFGDGPRVPFFVVSPYARKNFIDHTYHDHASLLKFIQRNWKLDTLSDRSRDNHPNPVTITADLYKPINKTPTIGDLMTMFEF